MVGTAAVCREEKVSFFVLPFPKSRPDLSEQKMKGEELERIAMKDLVISGETEYKFRYCRERKKEKKKKNAAAAGLSGFE